jgi:hypothetical protein
MMTTLKSAVATVAVGLGLAIAVCFLGRCCKGRQANPKHVKDLGSPPTYCPWLVSRERSSPLNSPDIVVRPLSTGRCSECGDYFLSRRFEVSKVPSREFFGGEGGLDPEDVDRAVHALAILQGYCHAGETIIDWRSTIRSSDEILVANTVTALVRLRENFGKSS